MFRKSLLFVAVVLALALAVVPAFAQEDGAVASGLTYPRGFAYDADGNLYIAQAGLVGDIEIEPAGEFGGPVMAGFTSDVVMIAPDGTQTVVLANMPSIGGPMGDAVGIQRVLPVDDSLWIVTAEGKAGLPLSGSVIELDRATMRIKHIIDLFSYEQINNSDGTEEIYSNPSDIAFDANGTLHIVDTGANTLFTWTESDGLKPFIVWNDDPVPTAIDFAADGSFYVGFLGTGIAPEAGHIEHWSADGATLIETFGGMTAITDILVDDAGNLYASQLLTSFGEQGPDMASGSVVKVTADGFTPLAEGLVLPYALGQDAEGNLLVSVNSVFVEPGSGAIVKVPVS